MDGRLSPLCDDNVETDDYANAEKLVSRAAKRESALRTIGKEKCGDGSVRTGGVDYANSMSLKPDHVSRPVWTCPDGTIYLEAFHQLYTQAYDFLVAIAEPVARPEFVHEYTLTPYSLYAAVATNIETDDILSTLERLSKNELPVSVVTFVKECTKRYGKAKLVLRQNRFYVESEHPEVLRELLRDPKISEARVVEDVTKEVGTDGAGNVVASKAGVGGDKSSEGKDGTGVNEGVNKDGFLVQKRAEEMEENVRFLKEPDEESDDDEDYDEDEEDDYGNSEGEVDADGDGGGKRKHKKKHQPILTTVAFQIKSSQVEVVKRQSIELDYPLMEEYDFRNDTSNPDVPMDLKPNARIRRYQERSLAKMFGNGRARSGIIVLPCGAGKTLTGVTAAQTIKKSVVCLCTNAVSVAQWKFQFQLWTNIPNDRICTFTSDRKEPLHPESCVLITTYTMISYSGNRSDKSRQVMDAIASRDWGLMLMDEVHVVPAKMFRRVVGSVKAHCRLGLTATLVREDDLISDLNFLIGPKLYEANWLDLTAQGYLANVQCVEVWCPMTGPFMGEYLKAKEARLKQLLYVMNPSKIRAVCYLVKFHEDRGDKIILFSDLVYSLKEYASILKRPLIYGETPEKERQALLGLFRSTNAVQTICISKVGDTSIDLPDANVIIQVSSHFGSRRQEAQRLGRILRPKNYTKTDGTNRSSFNAFFYTLVSTDTQEMFYSAKRQQYLIDQGYTFKIVTNLCELADREAAALAELEATEDGEGKSTTAPMAESTRKYPTAEEDRHLLCSLLTNDSEKAQKAEDNAIRKNNADGAMLADAAREGAPRRTTGVDMGKLSGGGVGDGGNGRRRAPRKQHPLFAKRFRR